MAGDLTGSVDWHVNVCHCEFPEGLEPGEAPFEGVRFAIYEDEVVLSRAQFLPILVQACEAQKLRRPDQGGILDEAVAKERVRRTHSSSPREVGKMGDSLVPKLTFALPFGDREAYEAEARGYLNYAVVEVPTGKRIPVVFYDPIRLQQDLEEEISAGTPFLAEPGIIVVENVTLDNMERAVQGLFKSGFFDSFAAT